MNALRIAMSLALALTILSCGVRVDAYRYLMVLHTAAKSHYNVGSALAKGLAGAGHQVTVISPFPLKRPVENFQDVTTPAIIEAMTGNMNSLLESSKRPIYENIVNFHHMGLKITEVLLTEPNVKKLLESNQTFDAVICEVFLNEAHFGFAEHYGVPLIGLGTFGAISWNTDMVGTPSPPSYVPYAMLKFSDRMTLIQRVGNLAMLTFERLFLDLYYLPKQEELYNKYFPNNKRSMWDVRRNAALVLLNQHVSLSFPRPYAPNMIEVGGMHINRRASPLPDDIRKFIEDSKHGVIYFSMGSNLKSKDLPIEKRAEILKTLRSLKQRVLWKFEEPNLPNKPDNVFIKDWFPQDDVLAHKNVVAFITHGGLLSTTESIYHGKPIVGIPIFGDQHLNMARAVQYGYGVSVDYATLSADSFTAAVSRVVNEPQYAKLARQMSERYRDQKETPLERAVYWVEHVTRQDGASYLRSASQDLNFVQYHNIDAIAILYGGILLVLCALCQIIRLALRLVIRRLFGRDKKTNKVKRN